MPQVPFPHILTEPKYYNHFQLRFVQPDQVMEGELIFEHSHMQENLNTRELEAVYKVYLVKEIKEARPARGDWSGYGIQPYYYHCTGECIGLRFKSALHEDILTLTN